MRRFCGLWFVGVVLGGCGASTTPPVAAVAVAELDRPPQDTHVIAAPCEPINDSPPADVGAPPPDAETTERGLAFRVLCPSSDGMTPLQHERVTVRYSSWTTDGTMVDSSLSRGDATFALSAIIPGLAEGLQEMRVGETRRIWIPEELAYGGRGHGPQGMLVFDIQLVSVHRGNTPPVPTDVSGPPATAVRTESGLASRVLRAGTGTMHPLDTDRVRVHYTGWTTDGQMFDSSVVRGEPSTFPLNRLIMGWTEGIQLMVEGEKRRFWIPPRLAYDGRPGPQGTLVFDVELLEIL